MIDYVKIFNEFKEKLTSENHVKTVDITNNIKDFFIEKFSKDFFVAPRKSHNVKEFLVDVIVSTRNPRDLIKFAGSEFRLLLAVESELGGVGAGSPKQLHANVLEDFAKLLLIKSEYKILIFTSLPYSIEQNHIQDRVYEIYSAFQDVGHDTDILLIHLEAIPKKTNGNPTNPTINLKQEAISAFLLSVDRGVIALDQLIEGDRQVES